MLVNILDACNDASFASTILFIKKLVDIIFIIAPVLLILLLTIDFTKAVIEGAEDKINHIKEIAVKRIIFAVLLFFIPLIVDTSFGLLPDSKSKIIKCYNEVTVSKVNSLVEKANKEAKKKEQEERTQISKNKAKQEAEAKKRRKNAKAASEKLLGGNATIYFLGLSTSDCIVIESNKHYGVIDASMASYSDSIIRFLNKKKVKKLDFFLITHAHYDHFGAFSDIFNNYKVDTFYIKKDGATKGMYAGSYQNMINKASRKGAKVVDVKKAPSFKMGDFNFDFYNREYKVKSGNMTYFENGNSTALLGTIGQIKVYFTGDIGNYSGEKAGINAAKQVGHVDIYKAAHHGFPVRNNYNEEIKSLSPVYTVITNAVDSGYAGTVDRLKNKKLNPNYKGHYVTGRGTVTLQIKSDGTYNFKQ